MSFWGKNLLECTLWLLVGHFVGYSGVLTDADAPAIGLGDRRVRIRVVRAKVVGGGTTGIDVIVGVFVAAALLALHTARV